MTADILDEIYRAPNALPAMQIVGADADHCGEDKPPTRRPAPSRLATDMGNAQRLVDRFGEIIRFCHPTARWHINDNIRWRADDAGQIVELAKETVASIFDELRECPESDRPELFKWARASQRADRISAMLRLAQSAVAVRPEDFDADPMLFNCLNGTIDLKSGILRCHRREDMITKLSPCDFDPDADPMLFRRFLTRIFQSQPGVIDYLQKVAGYCGTGSVSEQVFFFLHGSGCNGKSVFIQILMYVLGDYGGYGDRDLLTTQDFSSHPTGLADLQGKRAVAFSETDDGRRFNEAKLKDLTGELTVKARRMRTDFYEFPATHKLLMCSNFKPTVRGGGDGFWRRLRLIPFLERIADGERDPDLIEKLKSERSGILSWIVAGALLWQRDGLGIPPEIRNASDQYKADENPLTEFLAARCQQHSDLSTPAGELLKEFNAWRDSNGERTVSQKALAKMLQAGGFDRSRNSKNAVTWQGIGINHPDFLDHPGQSSGGLN